ncbi:MAG TPA: M20/M25/M40 family metallo-hydrolase [Terriglobales bacterium]
MQARWLGWPILVISSLALGGVEFAQTVAPENLGPLKATLIRLRDAALGDDYAYRQLAYLTDNIGARPVGSVQAQAAVDYVAAELRRLGLEVQLEECKVPQWVRGTDTGELVQYAGQAKGATQRILLTALSGNAPTRAEGITADVVVVNDFDELRALRREQVEGKIVLFNVVFDKQKAAAGMASEAYGEAVTYRAQGGKAAADMGAVASLVRSVGSADFRLPHTGFSIPAGIPQGAVSAEDAGLMARLAAQGTVRMHLVLTSENKAEVISYNVIADLKGSENPEQIVNVSGHLDSWDLGTGALDDAAGVAVAMQTAQLVQQLHLHPRRTLRVVAWMDEEDGGRGNEVYAKDHHTEFSDYTGAIESDFGAGHPLGFEARIKPDALPLLRTVQDVLSSFGANVITLTNRSPGADIQSLGEAGVPTFGITQDARTYFHYHHSAADTLDKVDPVELQQNAAAMAVLAYALADMAQKLPR